METPIYHITDLANLSSILNNGGLYSINDMPPKVEYTNIAYSGIQSRRAMTYVPCGPRGLLHDHVPFYFGPRSPMLYAISQGNVPSCPNGQRTIIHFVSTISAVHNNELEFVFTDGHAIMALTEFFEDLEDLTEVDWPLMKQQFWNAINDDLDRPRRRQAEFLVHRFIPWSLIDEIVVLNISTLRGVENCLSAAGLNIPSRIETKWYY